MHEDAGREWTLEELSGTAEDRARIEREAREADLTLLRWLRWLHAEAVHRAGDLEAERDEVRGLLRAPARLFDGYPEVSTPDAVRAVLADLAGAREGWERCHERHQRAESTAERERSSRQAWAAEAMRLQEFVNNALGASLRHGAVVGPPVVPTVCACISDDQAAQLAEAGTLPSGRSAFTRPVCAVHPEVGQWQPGDPVYPDEREDSSEGACSDPDCGVTWAPAGPTDCPRCGSPAVAPGTPWAEGGEPE